MNTPLVTIAIPIYNGLPYLQDTIQSVINQTYKNWILYLVNDGSTDESLVVMQKFAEKDDRIKIVNDGERKGLIARLNQSIVMAKTKYYARMDADDIMYITRIEEQFKFLESNPDVDVVGASIMTIDNNNNIIGSRYYEGKVSNFIHPTVMGKSEWFKANPYSDWAFRAEDYELWTRTCSCSSFFAIGKPLLFYREFGVPMVDKYIKTQRTLLKVFTKYSMYHKSISWYISNSVKALIKILLYRIFDYFGNVDYLVSKRVGTSVPKEMQLSADDLFLSISRRLVGNK